MALPSDTYAPRDQAASALYEMHDVTTSGVLTTASGLLFVRGREGYFHALDARTGALLWKIDIGGETAAGPMTYQVDGKQYIAVGLAVSVAVNVRLIRPPVLHATAGSRISVVGSSPDV